MMNRHQQARRRMESIAAELQELSEKLAEASPDSEVAEEIREQMKKLAEQMQKEAEAIQELADKPLPLDLDQKLSPELQKMAEQLQQLSREMADAAADPNLNTSQLQQELQQQMEALKQQQQQHDDQAMQPMQRLAQVLPLKQNEAEFTQLVMKQRDLADRLQSLKDQDVQESPELRARIRDLEEEQHRVREQLSDLLSRIEENAQSLPDEPEFDELRQTAMKFAQEVRDSGAVEDMAEAESQLSEFNTSLGPELSQQAAEILEQFVSKCQGMGQQAGQCLSGFNPSLGSSLQKTLDQLAPTPSNGMGGSGFGAGGSGGYSARMSTMDNVGMYGSQPLLSPSASSRAGGGDDADAVGTFMSPEAMRDGQGNSGFTARQTNPAWGGADWGVPVQYRRQAGSYLQQLAEELEP